MAAALLMMNMHGVVCASSRDLTIFRYSEKIPLAIMVDPTSKFRWDDIIMAYQSKNSISSLSTFKDVADDFSEFLTDFFNQEDEDTLNKECDKKIICVGYDPKGMFPQAAIFTMVGSDNGVIMNKDIQTIDKQLTVFHKYLGKCANIRILSGGMSDDIKEQLAQLCVDELGKVLGNIKVAEELVCQYYDNLCDSLDKIQDDPQVTSAISDFTVKDMVAMAENLIDTENLKHSNNENYKSSPTCEIGVVTMAEGFKWIKHSLYGV